MLLVRSDVPDNKASIPDEKQEHVCTWGVCRHAVICDLHLVSPYFPAKAVSAVARSSHQLLLIPRPERVIRDEPVRRSPPAGRRYSTFQNTRLAASHAFQRNSQKAPSQSVREVPPQKGSDVVACRALRLRACVGDLRGQASTASTDPSRPKAPPTLSSSVEKDGDANESEHSERCEFRSAHGG